MSSTQYASDKRDEAARQLDERIECFITAQRPSPLAFERLALDLFEYQYTRNAPYRRYCDRLEKTPVNVRSWRDVPAVPTASYGATRLACFEPDRTVLTFTSSGTTSSGAHPSALELDSTSLYDASLATHFAERAMPDTQLIRLIALMPSAAEAPHSSLSYMAERLVASVGAAGSGFFIRDGQLALAELREALEERGSPALVFGTAFAFVHFFDRCDSEGWRFSLPIGSRVIETGGFKGKSREVPREDLYAAFAERLGVPRVLCASEYGMCELGSQWYDANIDDYFAGRPPRVGIKVGPHWARATIVDPVSALPVPSGEEGLIQIFDLSNRGSLCAVLTGDLGRERDRGFELIGRSSGAVPKGCSIGVDALLRRGDD